MAIKIYEQFAPFANPADGDYPYGSIKNDSIPGAEDGTPLDAIWANDYAGSDAELFAQAGIVPSGQPDKLGASQRVDGMRQMFTNVGTVVDIAAGKFKVGSVICVTDREMALFKLFGAGWPQVANGLSVIAATNGNVAVYQPSTEISAKHLGAVGDGFADDTLALIDFFKMSGGKSGHIPAGRYLVSATLPAFNYTKITGDGYNNTEIFTNLDIEVIANDTASIFGFELTDVLIRKTVSTLTTKYDIHLTTPNFCKLTRVRVQSAHDDTNYSSVNVGGVWFDRPDSVVESAFCNLLDDCWMQNNSAKLTNITDSNIKGGYYWGHTRQFTIHLEKTASGASGALAVENVVGLIPSKFNGGIWIAGAGMNQLRIVNNEYDGNPLLDTGIGILSLDQTFGAVVSGNTFWGCDQHGIWAKDCLNWAITGNNFWKNNAGDNEYDDIRLESNNIAIAGNTITGNSHLIDDARVNKGLAVRLVSGVGGFPSNNIITGNAIKGAYSGNGIAAEGTNTIHSNSSETGNNIPNESFIPSTIAHTGTTFDGYNRHCDGRDTSLNGEVQANGTASLLLNDYVYGGQSGGFAGHIYVSSTRVNFPQQSRKSVYTIAGNGSLGTLTQIATHDGSGGGAAFTLTINNGSVVFTDTLGEIVNVSMRFVGVASLA